MGGESAPLAPPRCPRYQSLDLWRGVACLLVVLHHATIYAPAYRQAERGEAVAPGPAAALVALTTRFWVGVPLFFVISGYCIAATADSTRWRPRALATYFVRRIYPPYWVLLGLLCLLVLVAEGLVPGLLADDYAGIPPPGRLSAAQWLGNLTLTESWRPHLAGGRVGYLSAMAWTLCYEEQFYAVVGLTVALLLLVGNRDALNGFFFDGYWLHFAADILVYYRVNYASRGRPFGALPSLNTHR